MVIPYGWIVLGVGGLIFLSGFRVIRPVEKGIIETFGKYSRIKEQGLTWIIPFVQRMRQINITERMKDVDSQEIITKDNLNAKVDLVVFYKVKASDQDVKNSVYNVDDFNRQIVTLAQTTARNVIGDMVFKDVNSKRNELNKKLAKIMEEQTKSWGVQIVRVEMKEIVPPKDVQDTMNRVIKAENEKDAAKDFATAAETEADGKKRAAIKEAEGIAQGKKIVADANAYKIKIENDAAKKHFTGNAQKLKQYEVAQNSLQTNSKVILGSSTKDILKLFDVTK